MGAFRRVIGKDKQKTPARNSRREKATAYHEAGHAVLHFHLRFRYPMFPLKKVSIIPGKDFRGACHHKRGFSQKFIDNLEIGSFGTREPYWLHKIEGETIFLLAGYEAEKRLLGRSPYIRRDIGDYWKAIELVSRTRGEGKWGAAYFRYCLTVTKELVEWKWKEIQAVARALLKHKTLTEDQVRKIISPPPNYKVQVVDKRKEG